MPLPAPDPSLAAHSAELRRRILAEIEAAAGRMPFRRFMELALYAPGLGYYVAGAHKFGPEGDFVTAPELSPLFGRCVARQAAQVLERLEDGVILEFGAGSGRLAVDVLGELAALGSLPEAYLILEVSPELRERQRETLTGLDAGLRDRVRWLDRLPGTPLSGVVLANEVLDAMPVYRFRLGAGGAIQEQFVVAEGGALALDWAEPESPELAAAVQHLELGAAHGEGYVSEMNPQLAGWIGAVSGFIRQGIALLLDYGYTRGEYYHPERREGTLICHYRHQAHGDPLFLPGGQDITASVDFTAVAEAASDAGMVVAGYSTQAFFLMGCGLMDMAAEVDPADAGAHLRLTRDIRTLTLPTEMGERFKAMALTRGLDIEPIGFGERDLRAYL